MSVLDFFLHNWATEVVVESSFMTDITRGYTTLSEARRVLFSNPLRTIRIRWTGVNRNEATRILMHLMRVAEETVEIPLYSDQSVVSSASGTSINCDTTTHRFFPGKKIVIHELDGNGRPTNVQRGVIDTVAPTQIVTLAAIGTHTNGRVYPILDVMPILDGIVSYFHDNLNELTITFQEDASGSRIPGQVSTFGDNPSGFSTYTAPSGFAAYPIFGLEADWAANMPLAISRPGAARFRGRGPIVTHRGSRPLFKFNIEHLFSTRAEFFSVVTFFDSRFGRALPFWLPNPVALWNLVSVTPYRITADGNVDDVEDFIDYACLVMNDGTVHIRKVTAVVNNVTTWDLTLDSAMPGVSLADVSRACPAHLVRFSNDTLVERWNTDFVSRITLNAEEILEEKQIVVTDL